MEELRNSGKGEEVSEQSLEIYGDGLSKLLLGYKTEES